MWVPTSRKWLDSFTIDGRSGSGLKGWLGRLVALERSRGPSFDMYIGGGNPNHIDSADPFPKTSLSLCQSLVRNGRPSNN